jgi:hypothetical protein
MNVAAMIMDSKLGDGDDELRSRFSFSSPLFFSSSIMITVQIK